MVYRVVVSAAQPGTNVCRWAIPICRFTDRRFDVSMSSAANTSSREPMGRIIVTEFVSLDGVVKAPTLAAW